MIKAQFLLYVIAVLSFALLFAKQIETVLHYVLDTPERSKGVRVYNRKSFRDVNTGEMFEAMQPVRGLRLRIICFLVKC